MAHAHATNAEITPTQCRIHVDKSARPSKLPRKRNTLAERHAAMVDTTGGVDACWPWTGSVMQANGYGAFHSPSPVTGKPIMRNASAVAWEIANGQSIPANNVVRHGNGCCKTCCNPRHLTIGSQADNIADTVSEKRIRPRLKVAEVLEIVHLVNAEGATIAAVATRFGADVATVRKILRGKSHSKVTGIAPHSRGKGGRPRNIQIVTSRAAIMPTASSTITLQ